jgi:hypothetical protein
MPAVLTNVGIAGYQNAMNGGSHTAPQHVGWGESDASLLPANTDLADAVAQARVSGSKSVITENVTNDTYQVVATLTALGTIAVEEVGLFDGAGTGSPPSGDDMYVRGTFGTINLEEDDSIQFTIKIILEQPA